MVNSYVQVPPDSTGKKMQTHQNVVGGKTVEAEAMVLVDSTGAVVGVALEAGGNLAIIAGDTTSIDGKITACNTGAVTISAALPAGANAIGKLAANSGVDIGDVTLNAGTAAIGKLAANTGVDIGDVDVTSVVPGVAATNLGKAEDAAHSSGDVGVAILGVRKDSLTTLTNVDGDYIPFVADEFGRQKVRTVHEQTTYEHAFFNAAADGNLVAAVGGKVIKVHAMVLQAAGTVIVNIRTNNAAGTILASWTLQAREGAAGYDFAPYPAHWFQTAAGEALYVDVTAAVNVTINCIYTDDDAG